MMFLDCPAYLDEEGAVRCGLPAEVRCRFIMRSTDGLLESAMIRCPAGHWFNGPIESLTWDRTDKHDPGTAEVASSTRDRLQSTHNNGAAPACYLSRPARLWLTAVRPHRSRTASMHLTEAAPVADNEPHPGAAA